LEASSSTEACAWGHLLCLIEGVRFPESETWYALAAILFLIVISGLVSASEVAYFSMPPKDADALTEKEDALSRRVIDLLNRPRYLLATILICNNLVNVAIAIISFFMLKSIIDFSMYPVAATLLNVLGVTFFIVIFGEALPKTYATKYPLRVAYFMALPLYAARQLFIPVSYLLVSSTSLIENRMRKNRSLDISLEELEHAIELTADNNNMEEIDMLKGIVQFNNISVKQIMKARVDMFAVDDTLSFSELVSQVKEAGYSRIPVYHESVDNIKGILYVKDLLGHLDKQHFEWQQLLRPAKFVPESKKINDLLKDIQTNRNHLSIVVDEYGGVSGIITLEDILEEVIGDINDEYDEALPELSYKKIDPYTYVFDGKTLLKDFWEIMNIKEEAVYKIEGEAETIAGLLLEIAGKFPQRNDEFTLGNLTFRVIEIGKNRIQKVRVTVKNNP
jgi:putative hemolysin